MYGFGELFILAIEILSGGKKYTAIKKNDF